MATAEDHQGQGLTLTVMSTRRERGSRAGLRKGLWSSRGGRKSRHFPTRTSFEFEFPNCFTLFLPSDHGSTYSRHSPIIKFLKNVLNLYQIGFALILTS